MGWSGYLSAFLAACAITGLTVFFVRPIDISAALAKACWKQYAFTPQPDITAYETAEILSRLKGPLGNVVCVKESGPIPPDLLRHFTEIK